MNDKNIDNELTSGGCCVVVSIGSFVVIMITLSAILNKLK